MWGGWAGEKLLVQSQHSLHLIPSKANIPLYCISFTCVDEDPHSLRHLSLEEVHKSLLIPLTFSHG